MNIDGLDKLTDEELRTIIKKAWNEILDWNKELTRTMQLDRAQGCSDSLEYIRREIESASDRPQCRHHRIGAAVERKLEGRND